MWLNFDCVVFSLEAGLFFVMSRSLSARRWQQFYATIVVLMLIDFAWALVEKWRGSAVPGEWLWFDIVAAAVEGARLRFRPIIMTSFAFIFGVLPLVHKCLWRAVQYSGSQVHQRHAGAGPRAAHRRRDTGH